MGGTDSIRPARGWLLACALIACAPGPQRPVAPAPAKVEHFTLALSLRTTRDGQPVEGQSFDVLMTRHVKLASDGRVIELVHDAIHISTSLEGAPQWRGVPAAVVDSGLGEPRIVRGSARSARVIQRIWPSILAALPGQLPAELRAPGGTWRWYGGPPLDTDVQTGLEGALTYRNAGPARRGVESTEVVLVEGRIERLVADQLELGALQGTLFLGPATHQASGSFRIVHGADSHSRTVQSVGFTLTPGNGAPAAAARRLVMRARYDADHGAGCAPPVPTDGEAREIRVALLPQRAQPATVEPNHLIDSELAEQLAEALRVRGALDACPRAKDVCELRYALSEGSLQLEQPQPDRDAAATCVDAAIARVLAELPLPGIRGLSVDLRCESPGSVTGSLPKAAIRETISQHMAGVRACYESLLDGWPEAGGRVAVRFVIEPDGAVQRARVSSDAHHHALGCCVAEQARSWRFHQPEGGGVVVVTYPFLFQQVGGARR